jgi:hypothetical protein
MKNPRNPRNPRNPQFRVISPFGQWLLNQRCPSNADFKRDKPLYTGRFQKPGQPQTFPPFFAFFWAGLKQNGDSTP